MRYVSGVIHSGPGGLTADPPIQIYAAESPAASGQLRLYFTIGNGGSRVSAQSLRDGADGWLVPISMQSTWINVVAAWDAFTIDSSGEAMRLYVNRRLVATSALKTWGTPLGAMVDVCGVDVGPVVPPGALRCDEIMLRNYAISPDMLLYNNLDSNGDVANSIQGPALSTFTPPGGPGGFCGNSTDGSRLYVAGDRAQALSVTAPVTATAGKHYHAVVANPRALLSPDRGAVQIQFKHACT